MKIFRVAAITLLGLWSAVAYAQVEDARFLSHYPTAQRVQDDILASSPTAEPEEIAGRQAGRLMMLHNALAHTWSSSGNVSQAPPEARQLLDTYSHSYHAIAEKERAAPYWEKKCGYFSNLFETCRRQRFANEQNFFKASPQAAVEVATLYFPPQYHDRFVDLTGVGGSRQRFAEYQADRRHENRAAERREFRARLPWWVGSLSLIPLLVGFVLFWQARRLNTRLNRYEFENTTPGGVVEFANFEASRSHERQRVLQRVCANVGYLALCIGGLGIGLAVGISIALSA